MNINYILFCLLCQYMVNCDLVKSLPSVTFHLGDQQYPLTEEDYILWVCVSIQFLVCLVLTLHTYFTQAFTKLLLTVGSAFVCCGLRLNRNFTPFSVATVRARE